MIPLPFTNGAANVAFAPSESDHLEVQRDGFLEAQHPPSALSCHKILGCWKSTSHNTFVQVSKHGSLLSKFSLEMVAVYCIPYIFLPYKLGRVAKFNIENLSKHKLNQKLVDYIHLKGTLMLKGITTVPNSYSDQQLGTWLD